MEATRVVLLRDLLTGLGGLFLFGSYLPAGFGLVEGALTIACAAAVGYLQFLSEHRAFPAWVYEVRDDFVANPHRLVGLGIVVLVVSLLPLALVRAILPLYYGVFLGAFLGMLGYRLVFGVLRPVPEEAVRRV